MPQALAQDRDTARELSRAPATQRAYQSAFNSWARTCRAIGQSTNARNEETGQVWSADEAETAVAYYVVVQCGIFHLEPKSIGGVYLAGIASSFDSLRDKDAARAIRCAAASKEVTETLKGFQRHQDRKSSKASRTKIPFCLDMALAAKKDLVDFKFKHVGPGSKDHRTLQMRIFACMCVGITFMLRKSEHIGSIDVKQLRKRELKVFDKKNNLIKYCDIGGNIQAQRLVINIEFSKTDQSDYGRRTQHYRQPDVD